MKNINMSVKDNILTIVVDLTKDYGLSGSGKSIIIASSEGNPRLDSHPDISVGLNVYRKNPNK